jgi:hypothetical protein
VLVKEVFRAVGDHGDLRERLVARFKAAGGDVNRWKRADMEAMCDALVRIEDEMESGKMTVPRMALRTVRRQLERELWP